VRDRASRPDQLVPNLSWKPEVGQVVVHSAVVDVPDPPPLELVGGDGDPGRAVLVPRLGDAGPPQNLILYLHQQSSVHSLFHFWLARHSSIVEGQSVQYIVQGTVFGLDLRTVYMVKYHVHGKK
jgi:hypothetical protein